MKYAITIALILSSFAAMAQADVDTTYTSIRKGLNPQTGDSTFYVNQLWQAEAAKAHAKQAENLLEVFGTSISKEPITQYDAQFDSTAWQVTVNGGQPAAATVVVNPAGTRLVLRVGASPAINMFPVGDTRLRLLNYPSGGQNTDLFRVLGSTFLEYRSLTQNVIIRKTGP